MNILKRYWFRILLLLRIEKGAPLRKEMVEALQGGMNAVFSRQYVYTYRALIAKIPLAEQINQQLIFNAQLNKLEAAADILAEQSRGDAK